MATKAKSSEVDVVEESAKEVVLSHAARQSAVAAITNLAELRETLGATRSWEEIEPSFTVVRKDFFEDRPLVIGGFRFNQSKKFMMKNPDNPEVLIPAEFVSMLVAAYDPKSENLIGIEEAVNPHTGEIPYWVIVNDGSTGIRDQLTRYASKYDDDTAKCPPLVINKGLRKSEYPYESEEGVQTATTWYLG